MKYNPWRSNQSYTLYIISTIYLAAIFALFYFGLLEETPILWAYFVISTVGELYFIAVSFKEYIAFWRGKKLIISENEITFHDEDKGKLKTISVDDLLEFHYTKKGNVNFVYKKHGRTDFSFTAHVFSKKECELFEGIIDRISKKDAKVNLHIE